MSLSVQQVFSEVSTGLRRVPSASDVAPVAPLRALWPKPMLVPSLPPVGEAPRDLSAHSDGSLVELTLSGDVLARATLFERHAGMVRAMAMKVAGPQFADDVAQDALLEALSALERIGNPHAFKSWLLGVTVRVARRRFRAYGSGGKQRACDGSEDGADEQVGTSVPPDVALELKDMGALLAELPANLQHALRLRRIDGLKLEEVARTLGVSLATTKRWLGHVDAHLGTPAATNLDEVG